MKTEEEIKERIEYLEKNRKRNLANPKELEAFIDGLKWALRDA